MFCFLFCVFCVFVLFCAVFLLVYTVLAFLFVYVFTNHCHQVETQLQLINIISYDIPSAFCTQTLACTGETNKHIC